MRAEATGFLIQKPSGRVIPGHQLIVDQQLTVSARGKPIFVCRTAQPEIQGELGQILPDGLA